MEETPPWPDNNREHTSYQIRWRAAQNLRFFPSATQGIVDSLGNSLEEKYAGWPPQKQLDRTFFIEVNTQSAIRGALSHIVYSRIISKLLPIIENGESLASYYHQYFGRTGGLAVDYLKRKRDEPLNTFVRIGASLLLGPSQAVFSELQDPQHPHHHLLRLYHEHHQKRERSENIRLRYIAATQNECQGSTLNAQLSDETDGTTSWRKGIEINLRDLAYILKHRYVARLVRGTSVDPKDLAVIARREISRLTAAKTANHGVFEAMFGVNFHEEHPDKPFPTHKTAFVETGPLENPTCHNTHPSLQKNASGWRQPWRCPGQYPLYSPIEQEKNEARRFFAGTGIGEDGRFDAASALALIAINIAQDTIWKNFVV